MVSGEEEAGIKLELDVDPPPSAGGTRKRIVLPASPCPDSIGCASTSRGSSGSAKRGRTMSAIVSGSHALGGDATCADADGVVTN